LFRFVKFIIFKIQQKNMTQILLLKTAVLVYRCTYNILYTTVNKPF
jgi:hypothetical protein